MKKGEDGRQSHIGSRFTPQALLDKLNKDTAKWLTDHIHYHNQA
jgi:hypothetical protein